MHTRDAAVLVAITFVLLCVCVAEADTQRVAEQPCLAVLVDYEPDGKDFADKLQSLLEAEAALQWDGRLVERTKLDKLLDEWKLSVSGLTDPNGQLQLGKLIGMDCLLTVRIAKDSVKSTVTLFPSTKIIFEQTYRERLQPNPLAINIITHAIRAVREHNRDTDKPQVSIGSFYYADPHRKFLDLSINISLKLRQELVKDRTSVLSERLFPSDLLNEFELARGGFTEQIAKNLSAPPSDILLYGEFQPKPEQDLTKTDAELDFTLFVVSPTGLCENHKVEFSCFSDKPEVVAEQALKLIEQASNEVRTQLASGKNRSFSQQEFEEFKRQAFRLMPNPPLDDGDYCKQGYYRGPSQDTAKPEEYERALHMLECAMLFKGDDTQVLVCTGAILDGMAYRFTKKYSESTKKTFLNASLEFIERAYFIDSNWNTRGMYANFCLFNSWSPNERPPIALKAAQQIWNTRKTEPWHSHQIHSAFSTIFAFEKDFKGQCQLFLEASQEYEKREDGLRELFDLFRTFPNNLEKTISDTKVTQQNLLFAEQLVNDHSIFLQALGQMLYIEIYSKMEESEKKVKYAEEFYKHLESSVEMISELNSLYGKNFTQCSYSSFLRSFLQKYQTFQEKYNLKENAFELMEKYIETQMEGGNYISSENAILFRALLPSMLNSNRYQRAYELITQFLENYTAEGSADYDRMWLASERNRLLFKLQEKILYSLDQLNKIEFDDGYSGCVIKVVNLKKDIFGFRGDPSNGYRNGKAFQLSPPRQQAHILKQISGDVSDLACTDTFIGIATILNGFYLMDNRNFEVRHLTSQNSGLPDQRVAIVCDSGKNFFIGIPDKENLYTHIYRLNPDVSNINDANTKFVSQTYWRLKSNTIETEKSPVIPQTWNRRTAIINGETIEFLCSRAISAIKEVTVRSYKESQLLSYRGFELSYVYDFTMWQGQLIFATGNGLYISEPGSNELQCLISEPDLLFFSLCPLDDKMYIGTSDGLYYFEAERFLEIVRKTEPE